MTRSKTSSAWAYWRNLRAALDSADWPNGQPLVLTGPPADRLTDYREAVYLPSLSSGQQWATFGQLAKDEVVTLSVYYRLVDESLTADEIVARMEDVVSTVELLLRPTTTATTEQLTLATANTWASHVSAFRADVFPDGGLVELTVTVTGRI